MIQPEFLRDEDVQIDVAGASVAGRLTIPCQPRGIVAFAHGSGSSRHSPRNRYVAEVLQSAGLGTLLFDLLTEAEEADRANVFGIALLSTRLREATEWLRSARDAAGLPVGYFGASTGAGAALQAAADPRCEVFAVVSRGGRPDLAGAPALGAVRAPTLLIVGGHDPQVLDLNRAAAAAMRAPCEIAIVEGATHLFEEPGALEQAASLARRWFLHHLTPITVQP
jgi:dienelactone hydrolase